MENNLSSKFDRLDLNTSESCSDSEIRRTSTCTKSTMPVPMSEALMKSSGVLKLDTNEKQCKFVILRLLSNGFRINLDHQPFVNENAFQRNDYKFQVNGNWFSLFLNDKFVGLHKEIDDSSDVVLFDEFKLGYEKNGDELVETAGTIKVVCGLLVRLLKGFGGLILPPKSNV
ncbi:uncharacterized protein LOC135842609 [Planococcus citri]|uniref:uncharacterized protein LOC135842609 n=1 Tax=Planococcus citri TaxID=170843 RepID=UPI0031F8F4BA